MTTATAIGCFLVHCLLFVSTCDNVQAWATARGLLTATSKGKTLPLLRNSKPGILKCNNHPPWSLQAKNSDDDNSPPEADDDGWGEDVVSNSELRSLQQQRQQRQLSSQQGQRSQSNDASSSEPDLFIPIFTLVAVAGFGGLYAYETFRLYMNGELYLPGGN